MNKTRLIILPILSVFFALFLGWSTIFAQAAEKLENQFREIQALPAGSAFSLTLTDDDITAAANEYLERYLPEIERVVEEETGIKLNFSDPVIEFKTGFATASLRVTASGARPAEIRLSTVRRMTGRPPRSSSSLFLPYRVDIPEAITMQPMSIVLSGVALMPGCSCPGAGIDRPPAFR